MKTGQEIKLQGGVLSGRGEAKGFMEIDWVREQCRTLAGFEPYPGTLNLKVDEDTFALLRRTAMGLGKRVIPPAAAHDFCEARLLPLEVNGTASALIYPMVNEYYTDTVEVISPVLFKNIPGIRDGTRLELSLSHPPRMPLPPAVVFDLDGTLIDSVELYYKILCEGCFRLGIQPPQKELFNEFMGEGLGFWEGWAAITGDTLPQSDRENIKKRIMDVFEELWQQHYEKDVTLFPGVEKLLLHLHQKGVKMGVVTSSFYINKMDIFKRAGLEPDELFASVITRNDTTKKKPHPEPVYRCLEEMAVPAEDCLCVGDSPCDIAAGREAGLYTVGVLTGTGTVQSLSKEGPDSVIDSVAELTELTE